MFLNSFKIYKKIIILFFSVIFPSMASVNVFAHEEHDYIKVGILSLSHDNYEQAMNLEQRDVKIEIDYVKSIFKQLNRYVSFEYYSTYSKLIQALKNNEIDFIVGSYSQHEIDTGFITTLPIYQENASIWHSSQDPVNGGKRWACVKLSSYCDLLKKRGIRKIVPVGSFSTAVEMQMQGRIDMVVDSYTNIAAQMRNSSNDQNRIEILPSTMIQPVNMVAKEAQHDLVERINQVINDSSGPKSSQLYHLIDQRLIELGINNDQVIRYWLPEDCYPFFYRHVNGKTDGYLIDLFNLVEKTTGLKFKYIPSDGKQTSSEMLASKQVDIVPVINDFHNINDETDITDTFFTLKYVAMSKDAKHKRQGKTGVLLSSSLGYLKMKDQIFGQDAVIFTDMDMLLKALDKGEIIKGYIRSDIAGYNLTEQKNSQYFIDSEDTKSVHMSMLISKDNVELKNFINLLSSKKNGLYVDILKKKYTPFNLTYGYDKTKTHLAFLVIAILVTLSWYALYLKAHTLKLESKMKKQEAQQASQRVQFIQNVLNALTGDIYLHNHDGELVMNNMERAENSQWQGHVELQQQIALAEEIERVFTLGQRESRDIVTSDGKVWQLLRMPISDPVTGGKLVLTEIRDVTEKRAQQLELVEANKAARAALEARQQFLANMSHELRTPIAGMVGLLEMLDKYLQSAEGKLILQNVVSSSRHLHLLVNDILDYSKLEAGKLILEYRECSFAQEINELLRIHCVAAHAKGLTFNLDWQVSDVKTVIMDPLRIGQIINNLLSNAVKFTQHGEISVTVDVQADHFTFVVKDTGQGMSESVIEHVFEPFTQADSSIARCFGGTGLGLSIVKSLINEMGANIEVQSQLGEGSEISVKIPYQKVRGFNTLLADLDIHFHGDNPDVQQWIQVWQGVNSDGYSKKRVDIVFANDGYDASQMGNNVIVINDEMEEFKRVHRDSIELSATPLFPDLLFDVLRNIEAEQDEVDKSLTALQGHILVAEDNPINQMVFRTQLNELGLTCHIVENGQEALKLLQANVNEYDALITDCHMPVMDGYQLARNVRQELDCFNAKPIVGCTAEDLRVNQEREDIVYFDAVLYKPYGIKGLHQVLDRLIKQPDSGDENMSNDNIWQRNFAADASMMASIFVDTMSGDLENLKANEGNLEETKKIVHKIKGGAGAVGMDDLYQQAISIEQLIRDKSDSLDAEINSFTIRLENSIEEAKLAIV